MILETITRAFFCGALLVIGGVAITSPVSIRRIGSKLNRSFRNPFASYIVTDEYLFHTRLCGFVAVGMGLILALSLYRQYTG